MVQMISHTVGMEAPLCRCGHTTDPKVPLDLIEFIPMLVGVPIKNEFLIVASVQGNKK